VLHKHTENKNTRGKHIVWDEREEGDTSQVTNGCFTSLAAQLANFKKQQSGCRERTPRRRAAKSNIPMSRSS